MNDSSNTPNKKLVIVGASGFIGRQLVPRFRHAGYQLLLVGRNTESLAALFPDHAVADLESWPSQAHGFHAVLNLAVINNNSDASWETFEHINADLPRQLADMMVKTGISQLIQISSVHALDPSNQSDYARSKRLAHQKLEKVPGIRLSTLNLPLVWGDTWSGALSFLNRMPSQAANCLFPLLSALKPTLHIDHLAQHITDAIGRPGDIKVVSDDVSENTWYRAGSALIDYGFALSVLLFFWWGMLAITLWVRLTSPGPGIFAQERVGKHGKTFICYKFRTMQFGTPQAGTHEVAAASVTPVGSFLRRTKLDELPQVWNILKGEIRLVGPRPGLPVQNALFVARDKRGVFDVPPGISGWAQIHDVDMSDPVKLARWDSGYIGMRSLLFDIKIILATAFGRGQGDRVTSVNNS